AGVGKRDGGLGGGRAGGRQGEHDSGENLSVEHGFSLHLGAAERSPSGRGLMIVSEWASRSGARSVPGREERENPFFRGGKGPAVRRGVRNLDGASRRGMPRRGSS